MRTIYNYMLLLIFLIGCCMGAYAEIITIPSLTLQPGEESSIEIRMDQAPHGLSGYTLTIETEGSATITRGEGPAWAALKTAELMDSHTLSVSAGDLMDEIKPGSTQILLATVMITGAAGQTTLTATIKQMDDDDGNAIVPVVIPGKIDSGSSPAPTTVPTTPIPPASTTLPTAEPTTLIPPTSTTLPTAEPTTPIPPTSTTLPTAEPTTPIPPTSTTLPTAEPTTPIPPAPPTLPTTLPITARPPTPTEISYTLDRGWNLIGIPAQPIDGYNTASVFSQVPSDGHSMFKYGPAGWESVSPTTPLHAMDAYWIYANTPFAVTIQVQDVPGSHSFHSGWNLISPPGFTEKRATEAFSPLVWSYLIEYDGKTQQYDMIIIMGADDSLIVRPGYGYWIYLQNANTVSY